MDIQDATREDAVITSYSIHYTKLYDIDDEGLARCRLGTGGDWEATIRLEGGMGDASHVPQLHEDAAAGAVNGRADFLPAGDLLLAVNTRRPGIALALLGDLGCLGDDQGGTGPLAVILHIHRNNFV